MLTNNICVECASLQLGISEKKVYKWGYDRKQVARNLFHVKTEPLPIVIDQDSENTQKLSDSEKNETKGQEVVFASIKKTNKTSYNDLVDEILNLKTQELHIAKRKYDRKINKKFDANLRDSKSPTKLSMNDCSIFDQVSSFCESENEESKDVQFYRSIDIEEQDLNGLNCKEENNHENEFLTKPETPAQQLNREICFTNLNEYDALHSKHLNYFEMDLGCFNPNNLKRLNDLENIWTTNWTDQEIYL